MRRSRQPLAMLAVLFTAAMALFGSLPAAQAQDTNQIVQALESSGYYIEPGADASQSEMRNLVSQGRRTGDNWYFVVLNGDAEVGFAATLRERVSPTGNVLVHSLEEDGDVLFDNVDLATGSTEQVESLALNPFEGDWDRPADYMTQVIDEFASLTANTSSSNTTTSTSTTSTADAPSSDSGGGFPWIIVAVPVLLIGGIWFMSRRGKKKQADSDLETARNIRAELQTELDELANDVLVLSGPVDLSDNKDAINYYREATDAYLDLADEIPEPDKLEDADLRELSALGARVSHARWQMDAAEAILDGEPIPEKPKVAPPPAPKSPPSPERRAQQRRRMPQRQARPRVPYSRSRRRSGGGLLDILIAGAGMMGSSRRGGGMFGGGSRGRSSRGGGMFGGGSRGGSSRGGGMFGGGSRGRSNRRSQSQPRPGGGVFGSGSRSAGSNSRGSSSRRSTSTRSRSSTRRSSAGRSTSRRRPSRSRSRRRR